MSRRLMPVLGAVLTLAVTAVGWWLTERGNALQQDRKVVVLLTGVVFAMAVPALVGMWRRPADPLPRRLLAAAWLFGVGHFRMVESSWAAACGAGVWLATPTALMIWLTDRDDVRRRRPRWVSVALIAPVLFAVGLLLSSGPRTRSDTDRFRAISWIYHPTDEGWYVMQPNPLAIWPNPGAVTVLTAAWAACLAAVAVWVVAEHGRSKTARALLVAAAAATGVLAWPTETATFVTRRAGESSGEQSAVLDWLDPLLVLPALACACVGGVAVWRELVRPRLSRTDAGSLRLDSNTSREALRRNLVRTLGDPTVRIAFQSDDGWIDERGRPVAIGADDRRGVTVIRRDGVDIAALDHDLSLVAQPDLVQVAATSLAMSLEAQRLAAVAEAASADVRESAARLLAAAESGRLDVEHRIMSGPDRMLAEVDEMLDARPLDLTAVHEGLRAALADVRTIARGAIPASLEGEGLRAALDDLRVATDVGIDVRDRLGGNRRPYVVDATLYRVVADCARSASDRVGVTVESTDGAVHLRVVAPNAVVSDLTIDRIEALGGRVLTGGEGSIASVDVVIPLEEG